MTKENEKNPILNPQAEGSNTASGRKNKGKEREIFASSSKTLKETILELKSQLADIPITEDFQAEREKIKTKNNCLRNYGYSGSKWLFKGYISREKETTP